MHCKLKLFILVSSVLPTELSLHPQMDDKQSLPVNVTHGSLSAITEVKFHSGTFSCHHSVASCVSSYWRRGGVSTKVHFCHARMRWAAQYLHAKRVLVRWPLCERQQSWLHLAALRPEVGVDFIQMLPQYLSSPSGLLPFFSCRVFFKRSDL